MTTAMEIMDIVVRTVLTMEMEPATVAEIIVVVIRIIIIIIIIIK